ncbi:MAG: mismatch-specific DNA-glycosylase [Betaproteobacteria bacterium]|nr:mismatch-specific DNA-glycosylase [Betaproteobacteria bacterium]
MKRAILPDVLAPGLALVFCGTAPSRASAAAKAYYAKPGNRFWPALHAAGFTPWRFQPGEYAMLRALGIGLTDLCKGHSGNDDELPDGSLDSRSLRRKIRRYRPRIVAFTSKNAARGYLGREVAYGWQADEEGCTRFFVLTSPSGQAARFWDLAPWRELSLAWAAVTSSGTDPRTCLPSSGSCSSSGRPGPSASSCSSGSRRARR